MFSSERITVANPKEEALLKAAHCGAVARIRQLLAGGAPVDARDVNRKTAVMLAAQEGHVEAFRVLVEAGADLHATAFRQLDLLEAACRSGHVEIVQFLLERGLPVNGHWRPLNEAIGKMGHDTPLIQAVDFGHVDLVSLLLDRGADRDARHQGKTALQMVKERLRDPDYADQRNQYREIAALLGERPTESRRSGDSELRELEKFAENARRSGYVQLRERLVERCGAARPWAPLPDHGLPAASLVAVTLAGCKRQKSLENLQKQARGAGCHLVLAEPWMPGQDAVLVLFPTNNQLAVVAAVGTEGANYGVQTSQVIAWLERLNGENPFDLVFCNHESVGGSFPGPVKGAKKLAEQMFEFCPSCVDEGPEDVEKLARDLKKRRSFLLRWD